MILLQYNVSSAQIEAAVRAAVLRRGRGRGEGGGGVPSLRVLVGLLGAAMLLAAILTLIYKVAIYSPYILELSTTFRETFPICSESP